MGIPITVTVDDQLPFVWEGPDGLSYSEPANDGSLWMPILQKAAAKLYGNYEMLSGGAIGPTVQMLTGAPAFYHSHSDYSVDDLWDMIKQKIDSKWMVTCGSPFGPGTD